MTEQTTTAPEQKQHSDAPVSEKRPQRRVSRDKKPREVKEFEESILQIDRVTRVVKGGRRLRFRVSVIIGDQKGRVGFGIGKSAEVMIGIQKAVSKAKKSMIHIPIFNGTLPHPQKGNFKASQVLLFPATEGKGIIAGGAVRKILELAGVKDVLSKVHGSRNKLNVTRATFSALEAMVNQDPNPKKATDSKEEASSDTPKKESAAEKAVEKAPSKKPTAKTKKK